MKSTLRHQVGFISLAVLFVCSSVAAAGVPNNSITVVSGHGQETSSDGLSIYVKFKGKAVLLCTGGKSDSLLQDLDAMDLDADLIEAVIFFDGHSDNLQDPPSLLSSTVKRPKIYVSATVPQELFQQDLQADVVSVRKPISVLPGAWLLGPIVFNDEGDAVFEQVLVLDQPDGLVVIVSCDNPGIIPLVDRVREVFGYRKIKVVAGGFHLQGRSKNEIREISLRLQQKGVKSLALSSCTGNAALKIFRQEWGDHNVSFDPGDTVGF
jgi:7,8-dihydropterin-6-yl-methyl-4-(beta-D-ribofuranosyl)aminobenzene 5'-phosphate synthase